MDIESPGSVFARAARLIGGQAALGRLIGKHQTTVRDRLLGGRGCWAEHVLKVEAATGVSRHDLRPDIYPRDNLFPPLPGPTTDSLPASPLSLAGAGTPAAVASRPVAAAGDQFETGQFDAGGEA